MPGVRINCGQKCAFDNFVLPKTVNECREIESMSARATANYLGLEGAVADTPEIDEKAQKCADIILSNLCPLWVVQDNGHLSFRDGRHRKLGT